MPSPIPVFLEIPRVPQRKSQYRDLRRRRRSLKSLVQTNGPALLPTPARSAHFETTPGRASVAVVLVLRDGGGRGRVNGIAEILVADVAERLPGDRRVGHQPALGDGEDRDAVVEGRRRRRALVERDGRRLGAEGQLVPVL